MGFLYFCHTNIFLFVFVVNFGPREVYTTPVLEKTCFFQIVLKLHNCYVYFDRNNLKCTKQLFIFFKGLINAQKLVNVAELVHYAIHHQ